MRLVSLDGFLGRLLVKPEDVSMVLEVDPKTVEILFSCGRCEMVAGIFDEVKKLLCRD